MIGPKTPKPSKAEEREAYRIVTERDPVCVWCEARGIQRDHRKNRSQGGLTTPSNLQGLCLACHQIKTEHPAIALTVGLSVPSYARPELWPALRLKAGRVRFVLYDDEGGFEPITAATARLLTEGQVG